MLTEQITLSLVALGADIERRIMMATQLLAAHGVAVRVRAWDGTRSHLVIANADDVYGRNALEQVRRRGGNVLAVSNKNSAEPQAVAPTIQVADLVERLKNALERAPAAQPEAAPAPVVTAPAAELDPTQIGGLLQVCLQAAEDQSDILASTGPWQILLRRGASRIAAQAHSDLLAARTRLVAETWETRALSRPEALAMKMEVTQSLDAFLITGCEQIIDDLPPLPGDSYQLSNWPDLGTLPNHEAALKLSAALVKQPWNIRSLATQCGVSPARANAFCWAMLGSGLLQSHLNIVSTPAASTPVASPNILSRLARRFGLSRSERT